VFFFSIVVENSLKNSTSLGYDTSKASIMWMTWTMLGWLGTNGFHAKFNSEGINS
jgi:hypothetical protein